ncbi:hypothetical protein GY45DRAFT_1439180 [Cubamyces sp. BRFM 1775]|nr:hypothetical protein GY45DRAFT_1439180 [Cubamyces sp. BRFM 1775]
MSAQYDSELVSLVATSYQANLCNVSATALLLYDWVITFDREKALVWSRKLNLAGVLYVLGRLVGPSSYVASLVLFQSVSDKRCQDVIYSQYVTNLLPYAYWGVFSAFRTHALSGRNKILSAVVFLLNLVPVALNAYIYYFSQAVNFFPPVGCSQTYNGPNTSSAFILIEFASVENVIQDTGADGCCMFATSVHPFHIVRSNHCGMFGITSNGRTTIRDVLFVNGTLCFGVSAVLNILTLALLQVGENTDQVIELLAYFRDALASIMASRFLLELLEVTKAEEQMKCSAGPQAVFSTVRLSDANGAGDDDDWTPSMIYRSPLTSVNDPVEALSEDGAHNA